MAAKKARSRRESLITGKSLMGEATIPARSRVVCVGPPLAQKESQWPPGPAPWPGDWSLGDSEEIKEEVRVGQRGYSTVS